jgi:hypothetical protein
MKKIAFAFGLVLLAVPSVSFAGWRAAPPMHGPRDAPPTPRQESRMERRGYVWDGGHYGYHQRRYIWAPGHLVRERHHRDWHEGRWERHDDHYDWYRGEWYPRR